jgi:hypothetical protein
MLQFDDAGLGLTLYGLVQRDLVWCDHFSTSYAYLRWPHMFKVPNLRKNLALHSTIYSNTFLSLAHEYVFQLNVPL